MVSLPFALFLGFTAGTIRACQGAYKDSPYESFVKIKFVRSLLIGMTGGLFWYLVGMVFGIDMNPVVFLPLCVIFDSMTTELYKRGVRIEDLSKYKMPTIFHFNGRIIKNRFLRAFVVVVLAILFGSFFFLARDLNAVLPILDANPRLKGLFFGFLGGFFISVGGATLDTAWEGFQIDKFFRSTYLGIFWGLVLSFYTTDPSLLLYGVLGMDRFALEFHKTFIRRLKSGKFEAEEPTNPEWIATREKIVPVYNFAAVVFIYLLAAY